MELHPDKTKIVYCQDAKRRGEAEYTSFDFLGYTFRGRQAKGKHGYFVNFSPAMSAKAQKAVGQEIRGWHLRRRSGSDLSRLAEDINPQVRGWINYYGAFYRSELNFLVRRINAHLIRWALHSSSVLEAVAFIFPARLRVGRIGQSAEQQSGMGSPYKSFGDDGVAFIVDLEPAVVHQP